MGDNQDTDMAEEETKEDLPPIVMNVVCAVGFGLDGRIHVFQGCDASILLDSDNLNNTEKLQTPNVDSVRGYEAIDTIKVAVESACPNVVSCADVLTLSSFYSVVNAGGPTWRVPLGWRDSLLPVADSRLTLPSICYTITELKNTFAAQNLGIIELV